MTLPPNLPLVLPDARYRCTSCGDCCHGWDVPLLPGEGARFTDQVSQLIASKLVPAAALTKLIHSQRDPQSGEMRESLVGRGGECVALDEAQLCRVHAQFGAALKPRACQLYPFRFLQTPTGLRVGLSFSCPAVVDAEGLLLRDQESDIRALYDGVVAGGSMQTAIGQTVALSAEQQLPWADAELLINEIASAFDAGEGLTAKLCSAGALVALVDEALGDGRPFSAALAFAQKERAGLVKEALAEAPRVDRLSRSLFRTLIKASELEPTSALSRLGKTVNAWVGRGTLVVGANANANSRQARTLRWSDVESVSRSLDEPSEKLFSRWLSVTLHSGFYFGPAAFDLPIGGGLDLLALTAAVALFLARGWAAAEQRKAITLDDVRGAIRQVEAGVLHRSHLPAGFARALDATASLDLFRQQLGS